MLASKIDKNGRATIPAEIRKILDISEQDEIIWIISGNKVEVMKKKDYSDEAIEKYIENLKNNPLECFVSQNGDERSVQSEAMHEWYLSKLGLKE